MTNNIWEKWRVNELIAVDAPRGRTTSADYSGLHRYADAAESGESLTKRGTAAQQEADIRARKALNDGVDFSGFLTRRSCKHVELLIGKHETLGIVALVDIPVSHLENKIEVLFDNVSKKKLMSRNEFFNNLENDLLADCVVERVCHDYYRRFILLEL